MKSRSRSNGFLSIPRRRERKLFVESLEARRVLATVTLNTDLGLAGELRTEIANAGLLETIDFNLPAGSETITLTMGQLNIEQALRIDGSNLAGSGTAVTIDGNNLSRAINIDDGAPQLSNVSIENITVTGGNSLLDLTTTVGGGIRNTESLTLRDSLITMNNGEFGGGVANTGGGYIQMSGTDVTDNRAAARGAGIYNNGASTFRVNGAMITGNVVLGDSMYSTVGGGGSNFGTGSIMSIISSTISGNSAGHDDTLYAASGLGGGITNDEYGELNVINSIITDNNADFGGGAWVDDYSTTYFGDGTQLDTNVTNGRGGGLFAADGSEVTISGSTVSGNMAVEAVAGVGTTDGAAIAAYSGVNLTIDGSTIADNYAFDRGGAIYASAFTDPDPVEITITNSTLRDNRSIDVGGAINAGVNVNIRLEDSFVTGNSSAGDGGGIRIYSFNVPTLSTLTVVDSTISGNSSGDDGGGIGGGESTQIQITGSYIQDNYAYDRGAGLYVRGGDDGEMPAISLPSTLTIQGSMIDGNVAIDDGGGIHAGRNLTTIIEDSSIDNNSASSRGGGFRFSFADAYASTFTISDSSISGNSSGDGGGGMSVSQSVDGTIENSTIDGNLSAASGGGIVNYSRSSLAIRQSTISNNSASNTGGGLDTTTANLLLDQSTVSGNSTAATGGGVYLALDYALYANYTLEIQGSTITNNSATGSGGGFYVDYYSDPTIHGSIVSGNTSATAGPDLYAGSANYVSYSLIGDNSASPLAEASPDASGNIVGGPVSGVVDAMLGALADNGGDTMTHLPMTGSPAIDAGDPAITSGTDQRGFGRVSGGRVDMGSVEVGSSNVPTGDFDGDGNWDCDDIDALVVEIVSGLDDPAFDMNQDGVVTLADITDATAGWLRIAGEVNLGPGKSYLEGDANLDGIVDGLDFIDWNANKFTMTPSWCAGDFNADGVVDGLDFIVWNGNKFTSSDSIASPTEGDYRRSNHGNVQSQFAELEEAGSSADGRQMIGQDRSAASSSGQPSAVFFATPVSLSSVRSQVPAAQVDFESRMTESSVREAFAVESISDVQRTNQQSLRGDSAESIVDDIFADFS